MAKIFISHSSNDKDVVDLFKKFILNAGLGILDSDIAYTSAPETGVPTGNSIPQYIKDNIKSSDFVFFIISENYRRSEVCLNEMGAAWILDKNVKPLLLSDVSFTSVGWLYQVSLCAKISDAERLDELRDEFIESYEDIPKTSVWNRNKNEFLQSIAALNKPKDEKIVAVEQLPVEDSLGLLDYREAFDENIAAFIQIANVITNAMDELTDKSHKRVEQIQSLNPQRPNTAQARSIFYLIAHDMDQMSDILDKNALLLSTYFTEAIQNAIHIQKDFSSEEVKADNRLALNELMHTILDAKNQTIEGNQSLEQMPRLEREYNKAKNRLIKNYSKLIETLDICLKQTEELLKV